MSAEEIIKTWKGNPEIREEFRNDFGAYTAYCEAEAKGFIKIVRAPIVK